MSDHNYTTSLHTIARELSAIRRAVFAYVEAQGVSIPTDAEKKSAPPKPLGQMENEANDPTAGPHGDK